ncbi:hypothetical protein SHJG_8097 [Streptomyces hygroscopicus subsp. jinggangensis 5008]|nr:hypothetical protein SHJG_8097 [Streptomyces hygroscopicus subsp. jinggangensis 5008]AGF67521.1 hypothetical protein SHJGH_7859 [Streptomyces hygroscopicus subsp. jinggangensis TL01]
MYQPSASRPPMSPDSRPPGRPVEHAGARSRAESGRCAADGTRRGPDP